MKNPIFYLTPEQTIELRDCWRLIAADVDNRKSNTAMLKLSSTKAALSHRQLFMICVNIAHFGRTNVPDWAHEMLNLSAKAAA